MKKKPDYILRVTKNKHSIYYPIFDSRKGYYLEYKSAMGEIRTTKLCVNAFAYEGWDFDILTDSEYFLDNL